LGVDELGRRLNRYSRKGWGGDKNVVKLLGGKGFPAAAGSMTCPCGSPCFVGKI